MGEEVQQSIEHDDNGEMVTLVFKVASWPPTVTAWIAVFQGVQAFWELIWEVGKSKGYADSDAPPLPLDPASIHNVEDGKNELRFRFRNHSGALPLKESTNG